MDENKPDGTGDPENPSEGDTQEGLDAALESVRDAQSAADEAGGPVELPELETQDHAQASAAVDMLDDVNLNVSIELGRARMYVEDVLKLGEGAVVELDKLAGDPVDIYVNERLVARGEVLVLNENFCVRVSEIISQTAPSAASGENE